MATEPAHSPTNRIARFLHGMDAGMVKQKEDIDDAENAVEQEAEPANLFARNLCTRMADLDVSIEELAEKTGLKQQRIISLRSTGIKSMAQQKVKWSDVHAIAKVLETEVRNLFSDPPEFESRITNIPVPKITGEATPNGAIDPKEDQKKIEWMLQQGLEGPKAAFLLDALEMACAASLTSRTHQRTS